MFQSEVTVQVFDNYDTIVKRLTDLGYYLKEELLMKDHYFTWLKDIEGVRYKDLIKESFAVRFRFVEFENPQSFIVYKDKVINDNDEVVSEEITKLPINNTDTAIDIFLKSGLNNWCNTETQIAEFKKGEHSLCVQVVENLGIFIEYEEDESMKGLPVAEKRNQMIKTLKSLKLNIGKDFSCKKSYMLLKRKIKE